MRQSEMFVPTLREAPAEADAAGHRWLLRSGMIRQLAAGIYSYLPLGRRILLNVERIVREEMDRFWSVVVWTISGLKRMRERLVVKGKLTNSWLLLTWERTRL